MEHIYIYIILYLVVRVRVDWPCINRLCQVAVLQIPHFDLAIERARDCNQPGTIYIYRNHPKPVPFKLMPLIQSIPI